ncbi:MAG: hypothetical protein COV72_04175 [Candidatus Omnitrophica bacterium CG11_big_fil_rev_8_21_14_0_20_42_13]|uniref:Uncharacterized protein n=1 Tax=Candidatus Ghiorseimicrobium undicola TaxID=1974746 RepID=A0A2H0LZX6_9BACT|nr:MAG: hypothetical protein COV72_04175 [Candidatus Omnitrophica bacterium CG11_big_fil_rev_8_21_14_0_20_42_13]
MAKINDFIFIYGLPDKTFYENNKKENILFSEMRPRLLGARALSKELKKRKMKSTLICDSALGHFFFARRVKKVCLFKNKEGVFPPGALTVKILADYHKVTVEITNGETVKVARVLDADAKTFMGKKVTLKKIKTITPQTETLI